MSRLIGVCGYAGSGKDTVAKVLAEEYGFKHRFFGTKLREMAMDINPIIQLNDNTYERYASLVNRLGYETAKREHPEVRRFLVALAESARSRLNEAIWLETVLPPGVSSMDRVVISDVRNVIEVNEIHRRGGVIIYINRTGVGPANSTEERTIAQIKPDYMIINSGTIEDLSRQVGLLYSALSARD